MTLLAVIVETSSKVASTSARLAKVRELAACLRQFEADEIVIGVAYLSGETPQGRFGIGYSVLKTASAETSVREPVLSVLEVDQRLTELASIRGSGSTTRRADALRELFSRASEAEQQFLTRLLIGELRQGALAGVMVDAIAAAAQIPVDKVRRAAMYAKSLGAVAHAALVEGESALANFQLELLSPVAPMLAQTAADVGEALEQLGEDAVFEWKMDGARIQVHKSGDAVHIYTRSLNDVTAAIPEIARLVKALPAREVILDGEAIAFTAAGRPHPFQITMRRFGRKLDVEKLRAELPHARVFLRLPAFGR